MCGTLGTPRPWAQLLSWTAVPDCCATPRPWVQSLSWIAVLGLWDPHSRPWGPSGQSGQLHVHGSSHLLLPRVCPAHVWPGIDKEDWLDSGGGSHTGCSVCQGILANTGGCGAQAYLPMLPSIHAHACEHMCVSLLSTLVGMGKCGAPQAYLWAWVSAGLIKQLQRRGVRGVYVGASRFGTALT
eukprot:1145051-Pelagomonas_calceolata.AAC.8